MNSKQDTNEDPGGGSELNDGLGDTKQHELTINNEPFGWWVKIPNRHFL